MLNCEETLNEQIKGKWLKKYRKKKKKAETAREVKIKNAIMRAEQLRNGTLMKSKNSSGDEQAPAAQYTGE